jgi:hypothetical protein
VFLNVCDDVAVLGYPATGLADSFALIFVGELMFPWLQLWVQQCNRFCHCRFQRYLPWALADLSFEFGLEQALSQHQSPTYAAGSYCTLTCFAVVCRTAADDIFKTSIDLTHMQSGILHVKLGRSF